ncbi:MAG: flotillin family protein, partial [Salibacteraceae bacterium]
MRADIKMAFYIRVNPQKDEVQKVAQAVGCARASSHEGMVQLFEAKFSEALKTVGKQFNFEDLYASREEVKNEILKVSAKDLNGFKLDDAAIDYLEQTPLGALDENNILDSEGIKKITERTASQKILSNQIERDKQKTIKQQDVEAREAILELEKQLAEKEEKQKREINIIKAREEAETAKVQQEELLKSERARIVTEEEVEVATQNKEREVIVAQRNKERTSVVEGERVERDRMLEVNERERIVTLAQIEKEKSIEEERKNIQEVIRERVAIEKTVVDEEERIKDTRATAAANRDKTVAITKAEQEAEEALVSKIKAAEAAKQAAEFLAKQKIIDAEAEQASAGQKAEAIKILAEAEAAQAAAIGLAEAQVMEAKAAAKEKEGDAQAAVLEAAALAEAKGIEAKSQAQAEADQKLGLVAAEVEKEKGMAEAEVIKAKATAAKEKGQAEADVMSQKFQAEATGIEQKAEAMKQLDGVGKEHEEFKLKLDKEKAIELASIHIQKDIAEAQANVLGTALESAKIDIVGGENVFFDKIVNAISNGKALDRMVDNSSVAGELKSTLLQGNDGDMRANLQGLIDKFGVTSDDLKNFTISALLLKLMHESDSDENKSLLQNLLDTANKAGVANRTPKELGLS